MKRIILGGFPRSCLSATLVCSDSIKSSPLYLLMKSENNVCCGVKTTSNWTNYAKVAQQFNRYVIFPTRLGAPRTAIDLSVPTRWVFVSSCSWSDKLGFFLFYWPLWLWCALSFTHRIPAECSNEEIEYNNWNWKFSTSLPTVFRTVICTSQYFM